MPLYPNFANTFAPLAGAVAATRYVGGTSSGAPVTGTFAVGDFVIDQTGKIWICTVAGAPGTWVLAQSGAFIVNAATYGDDSTDATSAIQAKIDAALAAGGGTVFLPEGIYRISASLALKSGVRLAGEGRCSVLKDVTGNTTVVSMGDVTGAVVENLRVTGTGSQGTAGRGGIWCGSGSVFGARATMIRNVWVDNVGTCGIVVGESDHVLVSGCYVEATKEHGIYVSSSTDVTVSGCVIKDAGLGGVSTTCGFKIANCSRIALTGNVIDGSLTEGILVDLTCSSINITGGVIRNCSQRGFRVNAGSTGILVSGVSFVNNATAGIRDLGASGTLIVGCMFDEPISNAIILSSGTTDCAVIGCQFFDAYWDGWAMDVLGTGHQIAMNHISAGVTNGIVVRSGSSGVRIERNHIRATGVKIDNSGSAIVLDVDEAQTYAASNVTTDRTYDADTVAVAELADVVGTLISDLRAGGIVK